MSWIWWPKNPFKQRTATLRKMAQADPEARLQLACMLHNAEYRFYPLSARDLRTVGRVRSVVESCVPEKYTKGVFPTGEHTANCGEAMYVVDGEVHHVMWLLCAKCKKTEVVRRFREGSERSSAWCVACGDWTETLSLSEAQSVHEAQATGVL